MGRLVGISDVVGFHADNVRELRASFEEQQIRARQEARP